MRLAFDLHALLRHVELDVRGSSVWVRSRNGGAWVELGSPVEPTADVLAAALLAAPVELPPWPVSAGVVAPPSTGPTPWVCVRCWPDGIEAGCELLAASYLACPGCGAARP